MKNKMERKKRIIIICLLIVVLLFSVGYAVLAKNIDAFNIKPADANWNIEIIDIDTINTVGTTINSSSPKLLSPMSASFAVSLKKPGDAITYKIRIKNNGSIDAYLKDILVSENNAGIIKYSISGITTGKTLLNINQENQIYLKLYYNEAQSSLISATENYVLNFVYEQKRK